MSDIDIMGYRPAGPTIERFHSSNRFIRLIAGPVGSSKTTACCWEAPFTAMLQRPEPDGVRRAKVGILRDTYRNLYSTTLKTWFKSFPRELGSFVGSDDRPFFHKLSFVAPYFDDRGNPLDEYGTCLLEVEGRALGEKSVEAVARGWELSGAFIDEIDLCPEDAITYMKGRVQRYPAKKYIRSRGVWGAFNKPDTDHWLYDKCVESPPNDLEFFDQPGGLLDTPPPYETNPDAENLENLPDGYYTISAEDEEEHNVRRMLKNQWGASVAGTRIYPIFVDRGERSHILVTEAKPTPTEQLWIGIDAGGTPAAVIAGRRPSGRIVTYAELVITDPADPKGKKLLHGVGPTNFAERLRDLIQARFPRNTFPVGYCDPAAFYGADREKGEYSWPEIVQNVLSAAKIGCAIGPAPSNEIDLRLEAVRSQLGRLNDTDGVPQLVINKSCAWLRRGFVADYKYEKLDAKQPGKRLNPQKTATSHVHDALQYLVLGMVGRAGVTAGAKHDRFRPGRETTSYQTDDDLATAPSAVQLAAKARANGQGEGAGSFPSYGGDGFNIWGA